ncbi:MAG: N-acetylmuramoyl-L-alanine amidase [Alphaproteobacteria bacterium]|nr:N-acetylmuramoyl-L-alanine amidase [Alphaproteobacteria bacterium]MDX5369055.1 N-acetylmuramoyl-L-alanine amidase [Alphaproteobacteria bacterium]MDX5463759.1 N-acetylmuramoyl-L-alanine amidase [Alphaproteobacteria bacterium]
MTPAIRVHPSPNYGDRKGREVGWLVLHYTGMRSSEESLARLCDPAAEVSAHYFIDEDGAVTQLVPEDRRAWHAGAGCWRGERDMNSVSIGIELQNPGHEFGYRPFPDAQIEALCALLADVLDRNVLTPDRVIGHSDLAPERKCDPGELFPWEKLARRGLALPSPRPPRHAPPMGAAGVRACLSLIGYEVGRGPGWDRRTRAALAAFQRRWRPERVTGTADAGTTARLVAVAARAAALDGDPRLADI